MIFKIIYEKKVVFLPLFFSLKAKINFLDNLNKLVITWKRFVLGF
tara:strand:+ start:264 stop:398 length:135 start_codon:yes stop_codon:yes gene_type:complete